MATPRAGGHISLKGRIFFEGRISPESPPTPSLTQRELPEVTQHVHPHLVRILDVIPHAGRIPSEEEEPL